MLQTVSIIFVQDNNYVLQYRDNKPNIADPDTYGAWGGSVEESDATVIDAALREIREETGIRLKPPQLISLGSAVAEARAPANKGKMVQFHYFACQLEPTTIVDVREGKRLVKLPILEPFNSKLNPIAFEAIKRHQRCALQ